MKIIMATRNSGKLAEIERILAPLGYEAVSADDAGIHVDVKETGSTFAENAILKAKAVCEASGLPAVGDDSGLCVDALGGAPGVRTARYAGEHATDDENIAKLLEALKDVPEDGREARFECAMAAAFPDGKVLRAVGQCWGSIGFEKRGGGGFGYDPVFIVDGKSFAELSNEEKDAMSHRGKALRRLAELLDEEEER